MICFRCGSDVPDGVQQCPNCGQRFAGARKTFTATTTSFRALEKRRIRAAKEAEKRPFAIGDVVDSRYEIRDLIASGPLGTVYRVYDREIEIEIVLKVIHEDLLPEPADRDAFIKAIRRTRKLSQQHIVRIYDAGEEGELCYFTMQYLEGLTLRKVIGLRQEKEQRFTVREVEPIFNQLTMALGHAHRHTVHGDLKPENILILPDVLKVTDFNAFEALPRERFVEAADAPYLAPELRAGQPVDPRADIYSLGVLLYELITGRQYAADGPPPSEVLNAPEEAQVDGVDHLINKATALDPADRYQSAEAFSEALGTYIDAREIASVDIRAREPLLPEDVTRKIAIPVGLRDPETIQVTPDEAPVKGRSIQDAATVQQTPSMLRSVALEKLRVKSSSLPPVPPPGALKEAPAEASYVEELDAYDLIESGESVDIRVPIGLPSPRAVTLPPVDLDAPPSVDFMSAAPVPPTEMSMKRLKPEGPWFLRSNAGFVLSIVVVVGVVVFTALHFLEQRPMTTTTTTVLSGAPDAAAPLPVKVLTPEGVGVVNPSAPDAAPSEAASAPVTPPTPPVITPPTPPTPPSPPPVKETPDKPPVKEEPVKPPVKEEPVKPPVKEEPVKPPVKEEPVKPPVKEE
ncbi:protein kinase, partial [Myxococcota bacterium]|nr:protein kinase [Myxococcota bacterium]